MVIISDDLKETKSNLFPAETGFEKKVLRINKLMKSQKKSSNLPAYFPSAITSAYQQTTLRYLLYPCYGFSLLQIIQDDRK